MSKERCQYEGCRAWPRTGQLYCVAHPDGKARRVGGAPEGNQNARVHGLYAEYASVPQLKAALALPPGDLRPEIAVVRAVIGQLLAMELPAPALVEALDKATGALARMLRVNKLVAGDEGGDMEREIEDVLKALGMGG